MPPPCATAGPCGTWLLLIGYARWEGPGAAARLRPDDLLAGAYLTVAVTAMAFVLWYTCVERLGAARAGLLTGVAPVAAAATGVALGEPVPSPLVWFGIAAVAAGLVAGFRRGGRDCG